MENNNKISTKDELIKNFTPEQMEIYNYYINKFNNKDQTSLILAEDKEMLSYEKGCKILEKVLKAEVVVGLIVVTLVFMFGGFKSGPQVKYKAASSSIVFDVDYKR